VFARGGDPRSAAQRRRVKGGADFFAAWLVWVRLYRTRASLQAFCVLRGDAWERGGADGAVVEGHAVALPGRSGAWFGRGEVGVVIWAHGYASSTGGCRD
jgi:hypothetical protein